MSTTTGFDDRTAQDRGLVRQQAFECDGPVRIGIELGTGSVEVRFADDAAPTDTVADPPTDAPADTVPAAPVEPTEEVDAATPQDTPLDDPPATEGGVDSDFGTPSVGDAPEGRPVIMVEVRHAPRAGANWGLSGLVNWVTGQLGGSGTELADQAVRETEIEVHGDRLTVRAPRSMPLRTVPLAIVVHAPAGSSLEAKCGSADVAVGGTAGRVEVDTGSGDIRVDRADGSAQVKTGSGAIKLGPMGDGLTARSGSGDIEVTSLTGDGVLHSGSGSIWLGTVVGDKVSLRTGSGDLTVADAAQGRLQLVTGSGDLRIGIRAGAAAELDVQSGSGRTRSDLPMLDAPPAGGGSLSVRARTGSGDAVVTSATA